MPHKKFVPIDVTYKPKRGHHNRARNEKGLYVSGTTPPVVKKPLGVYPKGYKVKLRNKNGTYTGTIGAWDGNPEASRN